MRAIALLLVATSACAEAVLIPHEAMWSISRACERTENIERVGQCIAISESWYVRESVGQRPTKRRSVFVK